MGTSEVLYEGYRASGNQVAHEVTSWMILVAHEALLVIEKTSASQL